MKKQFKLLMLCIGISNCIYSQTNSITILDSSKMTAQRWRDTCFAFLANAGVPSLFSKAFNLPVGAAVWSPDQRRQINQNPMKADLCEKPEDYYYSSAKFYLDRLVGRSDGVFQCNPRSDLRCRPLSPPGEKSCFWHSLTVAEISLFMELCLFLLPSHHQVPNEYLFYRLKK